MIGTIWECVVLVAVLAVAVCWVLAAARPVPAATGILGLRPIWPGWRAAAPGG